MAVDSSNAIEISKVVRISFADSGCLDMLSNAFKTALPSTIAGIAVPSTIPIPLTIIVINVIKTLGSISLIKLFPFFSLVK